MTNPAVKDRMIKTTISSMRLKPEELFPWEDCMTPTLSCDIGKFRVLALRLIPAKAHARQLKAIY
jgi:hypothetical protein